MQTVSETGALKIGASFLQRYFLSSAELPFCPNASEEITRPSSGTLACGYMVNQYSNPKTCSFDFTGAKEDVSKMPQQSVLLLHTRAHSPTGEDLCPKHWKDRATVVKKNNLYIFKEPMKAYAYYALFQTVQLGNVNTLIFNPRDRKSVV